MNGSKNSIVNMYPGTKKKIKRFSKSAGNIAKTSILEASREGGKVFIVTASSMIIDQITKK